LDRLGAVDRRYRHALRRFAAALVGDWGRAEEIVQETLVKLWQRPGLLDEPVQSAGPWLFTVTRNLAYDELRCGRRRHEFTTDIDARFDHGLDDPCASVADTWIIQHALATLSYQHREVIVHAYYRRATTNDIAAELDIPPGTVKSRLHYALRALRDACIAQGITKGY
jgi:RNA polymerase sigma-70 factor, ECF subfamily